MQLPTSPRLPGVPLLSLDATGPEYSRWRRSVKFALETKDTWKYCNGTFPMPMPRERPALARFEDEINDTQPCLLEERRAWMRQDREVKLDIFLSLAEEVMLDVFEVGPPLPPTKGNAQQMLETLDNRFSVFEFEGYHHAFCHFLNLRVDQCASLDEFNKEFLTVLEDLHDYGQPLSNTQACSAYFSKLNCTQNPWVAKRVEEWDTQSSEPQIHDIMQDPALWPYVKPLKSKSSQDCSMKPSSEHHLDDDAGPGLSDTSTLSSKASHSRQLSATDSERQRSTIRLVTKQQFDPQALREALEKIPAIFDSERSSLHEDVGTTCTTPEWLSAKTDIVHHSESQLSPVPAPNDIPPLSLPPSALQKSASKSHIRSHSAPIPSKTPVKVSVTEYDLSRPQTADYTFRRATPPLSEHPAFRHTVFAPPEELTVEIHPALRPMTPLLQPQKPASTLRSCSPLVLTRATPQLTPNRSLAQSTGTSATSPDTVSKVLFRPRYDYSLPPSPSPSSSSNSSSTFLTLPFHGTGDLPWIDTPSSSSLSPIAVPILTDPFSKSLPPLPLPSHSQRERREEQQNPFLPTPSASPQSREEEDEARSIQPPVSIFSLPTTSPSPSSPSRHQCRTSSSSLETSSKRSRKAKHKRFGSQSESGREGKKEKEKSWSLGVGKMARLGTRGGEKLREEREKEGCN
ncbi:hypothetical protein yc1106_01949 [Curvularia clavata]|uniref:Uncharacterized protein n=1 Tax=Curvularia clavata TaxID=95742 RepID=A0A9Q8Z3V9_CURCL|nr:hypothetical protein yc1106_01949 [Curvularia clavata]